MNIFHHKLHGNTIQIFVAAELFVAKFQQILQKNFCVKKLKNSLVQFKGILNRLKPLNLTLKLDFKTFFLLEVLAFLNDM